MRSGQVRRSAGHGHCVQPVPAPSRWAGGRRPPDPSRRVIAFLSQSTTPPPTTAQLMSTHVSPVTVRLPDRSTARARPAAPVASLHP